MLSSITGKQAAVMGHCIGPSSVIFRPLFYDQDKMREKQRLAKTKLNPARTVLCSV